MSNAYAIPPIVQKIIIASISVTAFFLPIREFPKLLFLLIFLASSFYIQIRKKNWHEYDVFDYLLLAWVCSGFITASFSPFEYKEWRGAVSNVYIPFTLLFIKYTNFNSKKILLLLGSVLVGTLVATTEGFWQLANNHATTLMLHSVGHVNHSAIYLCMSFSVAISFCLTLTRKAPLKFFLSLVALLIIIVSTIYTDSRGSTITMFIIGVTSSFFWARKSKKPFLIVVISLFIIASSLFYWKAPIIEKTLHQTSKGHLIPARLKIWNSSLLIWRHNPILGIGIKNYGEASGKIQRQWLAEENRQFSDEFMPYVHAHSLYFSILAEQGILGAGIIFFVLLKIAFSLFGNIPKFEDSNFTWLLWLSAFGSLQVVLINGLVNTTLRMEHGLLFAIITGLWLSFNRSISNTSQSDSYQA